MVLSDRKLKVREIAGSLKMSKERAGNILHENLQMKKVLARWAPRFLTTDQKQQ